MCRSKESFALVRVHGESCPFLLTVVRKNGGPTESLIDDILGVAFFLLDM